MLQHQLLKLQFKQMLESKVAQFFSKVAQKVSKTLIQRQVTSKEVLGRKKRDLDNRAKDRHEDGNT